MSSRKPQRRADGTVAWHGVVVDISSYKQAEVALQESEIRFRQLAEAVEEGFFVYDVEASHYSYVNPAYRAIQGIAPDAGPDSEAQWLARIHPDDRDRHRRCPGPRTSGRKLRRRVSLHYPQR